MNDQRSRGIDDFGRKIDEKVSQAMPRIEEEVKRVITYLNNEVVPEVRQGSLKALRVASEQLSKLVDRIERGHPGSASGSGSGPQSGQR